MTQDAFVSMLSFLEPIFCVMVVSLLFRSKEARNYLLSHRPTEREDYLFRHLPSRSISGSKWAAHTRNHIRPTRFISTLTGCPMLSKLFFRFW